MDEQKEAWKKFVAHPEWKRLSGMAEYADKTILSNITNLPLIAASYSQYSADLAAAVGRVDRAHRG